MLRRDPSSLALMHTDGNIMKCVDDLAETGLDAIQAIDATAGMDIDAARAIAGSRLCFCGNVDCGSLLRGTPDEVYARNTAQRRRQDRRLLVGREQRGAA